MFPLNLRAAGIGLLLVTLAAGIGMAHHKGVVSGRAEVQAKFDAAMLAATQAAEVASENYRRNEADWQARVAAAETRYNERQTAHAQELASLHAARADDAKRLRDALAARPAASSATPSDPGAPDSSAASSCGELLAQGMQLSGELAESSERLADSVRALQDSWPGK